MANLITRQIPNTITCCNLISGCIAVSYALASNYDMAFLFIVIGAVFDFFDGMSARLLGVSSPIGKELDSLADDVTFGVAPASIVFDWLYTQEYPEWLGCASPIVPYIAFLIAAFSALRLAKFNLDERQATSFIGLPTPANALFWASLIVGSDGNLPLPLVLVLILVCCWLLIAEIPMFALKFKHWGWQGNEVKYVFVLLCIPSLLLLKTLGFAFVVFLYVVMSIIYNGIKKH